MNWEQLVYGKLVQSADGPIVPRLDYRVTGASTGYPDELVAQSHPNRMGLNTSDLFSWQEYPWNDVGGGFLVRGTVDRAKPVIIASRIRGRPEKGEGQSGRLYVQAHYAVTTLQQWSPAAIALLPTLLHANPMTAEDRAMAPLRLDDDAIRHWLDGPLGSGWLEEVAMPLAAVMSGIPFSVQDWHASIDAFLERCALCACAVPRTLAWRLSVGAGLAEMKGDVSLGLGQIAPSIGVRVIGTTVYGGDVPQLERGHKYVEWLRRHASGVGTRAELIARIDGLLPRFADPDAIPAQVDAGDAARQIAEYVVEQVQLSGLNDWLLGGPGPKPDTRFRLLQKDALQGILRNLRPRGLELLSEFLTTGTFETLSRVAEEDTAIGRLAAMTARLTGQSAEAPRVEDVEYLAGDALHPGLVALIKENLTPALTVGRLDATWSGQVRDHFRQIPWLEAWFAERSEDWFWLAIGLVAGHRDERLLEAMRLSASPAVEPFETLLSPGQSIQAYENAAKALIESARKRHQVENLDWLFIHLIENGRVLAAIALADACKNLRVRIDAAKMLTEHKRDDDERRVTLAQALAGELETLSQQPKGAIMLGLLVGTSRLPDMSEPTRTALARQLGNPYAEILIGTRDSGQPVRLSEQSEEIAQQAFQNSRHPVDRLWSMLCATDEKSVAAQSPLLRLINDKRLLSAPLGQTPKFVVHLRQSRPCELPDIAWTRAETAWIKRLLRDRMSLLQESLVTARSTNQLINGLSVIDRTAPIQPERKELIEELIRLKLDRDSRLDRLQKKLSDWKWHRAPVWRLLFLPWDELYHDRAQGFPNEGRLTGGRTNPDLYPVTSWKLTTDLSSGEADLIGGLPYGQYLALAALGATVSPGPMFCEGFVAFCSEAKKFSSNGLARLARFSHDANADDFTSGVIDILLARIEQSSMARDQLMAQLSRGNWSRFAAKLISNDMLPLVGAILAALRLLPEEQRAQMESRILNPNSAR